MVFQSPSTFSAFISSQYFSLPEFTILPFYENTPLLENLFFTASSALPTPNISYFFLIDDKTFLTFLFEKIQTQQQNPLLKTHMQLHTSMWKCMGPHFTHFHSSYSSFFSRKKWKSLKISADAEKPYVIPIFISTTKTLKKSPFFLFSHKKEEINFFRVLSAIKDWASMDLCFSPCYHHIGNVSTDSYYGPNYTDSPFRKNFERLKIPPFSCKHKKKEEKLSSTFFCFSLFIKPSFLSGRAFDFSSGIFRCDEDVSVSLIFSILSELLVQLRQ